MSIGTLVLLIAIGVIAGIVSGVAGVGGGIIVVPVLVFIFGFSQHNAQGTSIMFMLPPIGILAAYNYYKAGYGDIKYAILLSIAFIIGGYLGSKLSINLAEATVKKIFGVILLVVALKMIFFSK
ncbi:MAG: TSUP family transporter [Bacteroidota bacterium]